MTKAFIKTHCAFVQLRQQLGDYSYRVFLHCAGLEQMEYPSFEAIEQALLVLSHQGLVKPGGGLTVWGAQFAEWIREQDNRVDVL